MRHARKHLPSTSALRVIEALDRLGGVSAAAEDLALTQGAVSRQVQALEAQVGLKLARREGRRLILTDDAKRYAAEVRMSLDRIASATMQLQSAPPGGTIRLAILPAFGMQWLMPRLPDFARKNPDVTVNMATRLEPFAFSIGGFDAAIRFGQPPWDGLDHLLLKHEALVPVAAPALLDGRPTLAPADIAALPLLHIQTRLSSWPNWFAHHIVTGEAPRGSVYDQFSTIIQAARHGLGAALLPSYLIEQDLASGVLIALHSQPFDPGDAYFLVWPRSQADNPDLCRLRDWLATQAEPEDLLPR